MKRVLSLVLVLLLVFGAVMPSFAEEVTVPAVSQETQDLADYGIIIGDGTGLNEAGTLTRGAMAKLLAYFYGREETAATYAVEASFTDLNEGAWYIPWIAYAEVSGWMVGDAAGGTFRPDDAMKAQEVNQLMIRVLGYTNENVAWNEVNAKATELGVAITAADNSLVLRGEAFKAIRMVLDATPVDGTMTLGSTLDLPGYVAPVAPVTDLMVESVMANNLKEVVVKFNQAVDKATVLAANFSLSPAAGTLTPVLGEDGMTVTITTGTTMTNQGNYKLTSEKVATATEVKLAKVVTEFTSFDATLPTVEGITVTGPKTFDVTFSEPMNVNGTITVKSSNTTLSVQSAPTDGTNVVTVTLYTALVDGTSYDVTIKDYEDFAGYKNVIKTIAYTYAKDASAPTVSLVSANQQYVVVEFNKPVTGLDENYFYHTFSAWKPMGVYLTKADMTAGTPKVTTSTTNVTKVYVQFATTGVTGQFPLQPGNVNVTVLGAVGSAKVKDNWGNELATTALAATILADLEAPTVTKVEATSNLNIAVTFSKAVAPGTTANYEILKSDGTTISGLTFTVTAASATKVNLGLSDSLLGETVVVNVKNIEDTTLNKNKLSGTSSSTITFVDKEFAGINRVEFAAGTPSVLYVVYNEAMSTSALAIANYNLLDNATTTRSLSGPATFFGGNKVVKIELSATEAGYLAAGTDSLVISNAVTDVAGNGPDGFQLSQSIVAIGSVQPNIVASGLKAVDKNTVTIQYDQELVSVMPTDYLLTIDNATYAAATAVAITNNSTGSLVTLTFTATIPADVDVTNVKIKATYTAGTVNVFAQQPAALVATVLVDKIAPSLSTKELTDTTHITLTYNEALNPASVSLYTYTVGGNTVSTIDTTDAATGVIVLELGTAVATDATPSVTQALDIQDILGNKRAPSAAVTVADKVAPTVVSAAFTNATTLVITYSEAVTTVLGDYTPGAVSNTGGSAVTFTASAIAVSGNVVTLTVAGDVPLVTGDTAVIAIAATVLDGATNAITPVAAQAVTGF